MDKLVRRVTVVQKEGETRQATIVYENDEDSDDDHRGHAFPSLERAVRHLLKADVILAQEAYQRHLKSVSNSKRDWLLDEPSNILKAYNKAGKEASKAGVAVFGYVDDEDEDKDED
jgi:hypothetical protein